MMLAALGVRWIARPAHCGSISASRWADNGRRTTGLGSPQRRRERRGENSFSDGNGRRPEAHELGQRATFNGQRSGEWRVASDGDPRAPQAPNDGRRATRALQTPNGAATRDDATRDFADTERRGDEASHHLRNHRAARRRAPGHGRRFYLHTAQTAPTMRPHGERRAPTPRRQATRDGNGRRLAMRDTATPAGVPNKPMMLAAANFTKDRRPAWGGSISASR